MEEDLLTAVTDKELPGAIVAPLPSLSNRWTMIIMIITMIIIMIIVMISMMIMLITGNLKSRPTELVCQPFSCCRGFGFDVATTMCCNVIIVIILLLLIILV